MSPIPIMQCLRVFTGRPAAVTVIGLLFILSGMIGLVYHLTEFKAHAPFPYELLWICALRALAVIAGVFLLRAHNWARWVLVLWLGYHVGLGALHSTQQAVAHAILLAVIAYFLFRPSTSRYFNQSKIDAQDPAGSN